MIVEYEWVCVNRRLATMEQNVPQGVCNGQEFFLVFSSQFLVFSEQRTAVASGQCLETAGGGVDTVG